MKLLLLLSILLSLVIVSCGDDDAAPAAASGTTLSFSLAAESINAIPAVAAAAFKDDYYIYAAPADGTAIALTAANFFKFECFMPGSDNFCPSTIDAQTSLGDSSPYKLTTNTVIGLLYHVEMYLENVYSDSGEHETCDSFGGSETTTPAATGATTHLIFDTATKALYDCAGSSTFDGHTVYALYNKAEAAGDDTKTYSFLITMKAKDGTYGLSDSVMQGHVRVDADGDPVIVAFNVAGYDDKDSNSAWTTGTDYSGRTVGIFNTVTHKFVLKNMSTQDNATDDSFMAMGTGGRDSDGAIVSGNFMAAASSENSGEAWCYSNANIPVVATGSCTDVIAYFNGTAFSWDAIGTYLGLTATDKTNLAGYEAVIGDGATDFYAPAATSEFPSVLE